MKRRAIVLMALAGFGVLVAAWAMALDARAPEKTSKTTAPVSAAMRAVVDPETGQIGSSVALPPTEEKPARPATTTELHEEILPDGSRMVDLQGTGEEFMVMKVDANGKRSMACVHDPAKALAATPTTPAPAAVDRGDR